MKSLTGTTTVMHLLTILFLQGLCFKKSDEAAFVAFLETFHREYTALQVPDFGLDYRQNFAAIPGEAALQNQKAFFDRLAQRLQLFDIKNFSKENRLHYDHIVYQVGLNRERLALESAFVGAGRPALPGNGLYGTDTAWYRYYIKFHTGINRDPKALFAFGQKEVQRVKQEINRIRQHMGFAGDSAGFYRFINSRALLLDNKDSVLQRYERIKKTVYANLGRLFEQTRPDELLFMEWPGAGPYTPPGYYSPATDNAFDRAVFYFNFYGRSHNTRCMHWLFIHEGVPGHHYQWTIKNQLQRPAFVDDFYYPGNFEGWAAYAEYLGKDLGLYQDHDSWLGKWEWDLVRSVRILIDVGIHYYGWTEEQALACWKSHIPNQDDIALREIKRCAQWPAQALSYKAGAACILDMCHRAQKSNPAFSIKKFHSAFLRMGSAPLTVIEKHINAWMEP